jgi:hypothetical protein
LDQTSFAGVFAVFGATAGVPYTFTATINEIVGDDDTSPVSIANTVPALFTNSLNQVDFVFDDDTGPPPVHCGP